MNITPLSKDRSHISGVSTRSHSLVKRFDGIYTGPYFDSNTPTNITAQLGSYAYLPCKVRQLGNKSVSLPHLHRNYSTFNCTSNETLPIRTLNISVILIAPMLRTVTVESLLSECSCIRIFHCTNNTSLSLIVHVLNIYFFYTYSVYEDRNI